MNQEQVEEFLDTIGAPMEYPMGEWLMAGCPLAPFTQAHKGTVDSNPSFGVKIEDEGMSFFHCFTCHAKGPVSDLAKRLGRLTDDPELVALGKRIERSTVLSAAETAYHEWEENKTPENKYEALQPKVSLDADAMWAKYPSVFTEPRALAYLRRRGITFSAIISLALRYDAKEWRILFPVWGRGGELRGFTGRSIRNNEFIAREDARLRELRPKRKYPKIRDYHGLEKRHLLLGRRGRGVDQRNSSGSGQRASQKGQGNKRYAIAVEGLFGLGRLVSIVPEIDSFALLGSEVTDGKIQRMVENNQAIYWLTDNDGAGRDCLFGRRDETGKHDFKSGALYKVGNKLPQFIMHWPELDEPVERPDGTIKTHKEDPDELIRSDVYTMLDNAEIYVHRGR